MDSFRWDFMAIKPAHSLLVKASGMAQSKLSHLSPRKGFHLSPLCSLGPVLSLCCSLHCAQAACFRSHFPTLMAFTHFHHLLAEKRATLVLYLDLKALCTYWNSTLGQFSGFSKYMGEFLPAALWGGHGACCCCRCWDAGKSIPNKQHMESQRVNGCVPRLQLGKWHQGYKYPTSPLQGASPKPPGTSQNTSKEPRSRNQLLAGGLTPEVCEVQE